MTDEMRDEAPAADETAAPLYLCDCDPGDESEPLLAPIDETPLAA